MFLPVLGVPGRSSTVAVALQSVAVVQLEELPPCTYAVFVILATTLFGFTGIETVQLLDPSAFNEVETQVIACPTAEHPDGTSPIVNSLGIVSVIVIVPLVSLPSLPAIFLISRSKLPSSPTVICESDAVFVMESTGNILKAGSISESTNP